MWTVLTCIRDDHDLRLVVLAALICATASVTALRFHKRSDASQNDTANWSRFAITGVIAGSGVWATHFIAMLAYNPDLPIRYEVMETAGSLLVAIVGMGAGFMLAARRKASWSLPVGGVVIGLSIVAMHFMGISAIRAAFGIEWRWGYVVASIACAVGGSTAALFASRYLGGLKGWIVPPSLLVLGIVGLHFTAMAAIVITPDLTLPQVQEVMSRTGLAVMVSSVAMLIILGAITLVVIEAQSHKNSLKSLDMAFQGVPSGLALFDASGRLVLRNAGYDRLSALFGMYPTAGVTRIELLRQAALSGHVDIPNGDVEAWIEAKTRERSTGEPQEWQAPQGQWVRTEITQLENGGTITVLNDVSAMRAATDSLTEARDRAEAASRAKSDFLTNMSHEIRTPLNGVLGMVQVMEADALSPAQRDRLRVVKESGVALLAILNDLLDLSKIQAGKLELDVAEIDMAHMAQTVAAAFEGAAAARDLTLSVEVVDGAGGLWMGDGLRLRQVLSNLIGNGLKFTHEGEVRLTIAPSDTGLTFSIKDTGIGIAPDHLPTLFDKFSQADATMTRRYGGSGLGLSICKDLVELMGGTITVESVLGEGARFTVSLPMVYAGPATQKNVTQGAATDRVSNDRLSILAAEDNGTNQLVLRSLLEPLDCELMIVGNGREAVDAYACGRFDLILMDIQMPEMNGLEATTAIRAHEAALGRPRIPIIALSANVMKHQIEEYMAVGMNSWIAKPIELEKLYAGLELALSQTETQTAA